MSKKTCLLQKYRVVDPHHFTADPNPAFHFNENPDPDPAPHQSDGNLRPWSTDPPGLHLEPPQPSTALFFAPL
jgi:hypothetical protein